MRQRGRASVMKLHHQRAGIRELEGLHLLLLKKLHHLVIGHLVLPVQGCQPANAQKYDHQQRQNADAGLSFPLGSCAPLPFCLSLTPFRKPAASVRRYRAGCGRAGHSPVRSPPQIRPAPQSRTRSALTAFSRRAGLSSSVTMEMLLAPFAEDSSSRKPACCRNRECPPQ